MEVQGHLHTQLHYVEYQITRQKSSFGRLLEEYKKIQVENKETFSKMIGVIPAHFCDYPKSLPEANEELLFLLSA